MNDLQDNFVVELLFLSLEMCIFLICFQQLWKTPRLKSSVSDAILNDVIFPRW